MRVFRDLRQVDQLESGVPRILETYSRDCFSFSDNFLRMAFPASEVATEQVTEQPVGQVREEVQKVVSTLEVEMKLKELMDALE